MQYHNQYEHTLDEAVEEKMQILRDFCVVDRDNREEIKRMLLSAVADAPKSNFDYVLDRVTRTLIKNRLDRSY